MFSLVCNYSYGVKRLCFHFGLFRNFRILLDKILSFRHLEVFLFRRGYKPTYVHYRFNCGGVAKFKAAVPLNVAV